MFAEVEDMLDPEAKHRTYRLRLVPRAYRSTLVETQEIFLDKSVPEIIALKLARVGLEREDLGVGALVALQMRAGPKASASGEGAPARAEAPGPKASAAPAAPPAATASASASASASAAPANEAPSATPTAASATPASTSSAAKPRAPVMKKKDPLERWR